MRRSGKQAAWLIGASFLLLVLSYVFNLVAGPRRVWTEARQQELARARSRVHGLNFARHEAKMGAGGASPAHPGHTHGVSPAEATEEAYAEAETRLRRLEGEYQATLTVRYGIASALRWLALLAAVAGAGIYGLDRLRTEEES